MKTTEAKRMREDLNAALQFLDEIRLAVGDPERKLMRDDLVDYCRRLRTAEVLRTEVAR